MLKNIIPVRRFLYQEI